MYFTKGKTIGLLSRCVIAELFMQDPMQNLEKVFMFFLALLNSFRDPRSLYFSNIQVEVDMHDIHS